MARAKKAGVRKAASSGKAKASKVGASKADAGKAEANKPVASKKTKKVAKIGKKKVTKKKMVKRKAKQVANEQTTTEPVASMPVADSPTAASPPAQETAKNASAATGAAAETKSAGDLNKSEWVREYLETHPRAKAKEIVAALAEQGVTVTPGYAAGLRFKARMAKKKSRQLAKKAAVESGAEPRSGVATGKASTDRFSLDSLLAAKKLAESLGGLEAARAAVAALVKLTG